MDFRNYRFINKLLTLSVATSFLFSSITTIAVAEVGKTSALQNQSVVAAKMENLDRGAIAISLSEGNFISWRLFKREATGYSKTGLTGTDFNIYRDGALISTVSDSTNYLDKDGEITSKYYVCGVANGKEIDKSAEISPSANNYLDIPIQKPEDGVTTKGEAYTYSAGDMSVGDVDGDGQYEYFIKWVPSNAKDNSQRGYTGNTFIDCYKFDGTRLYRLDLGINIRSGEHYTQFMVYDFDGDGKAEIMFKTAPGTKTIKYDKAGKVVSEKYITMPKDDVDAGYSNTDDYTISASGYFNHIVDVFMNWQKHPEVTNGHWPKTLEECFGVPVKYKYPLSTSDAKELANYFFDVYAISRSDRNKQLRQYEGFILKGPEYLTIFNGQTGDEMETIQYKYGRIDDGLIWGDYGWIRIEPGNTIDRYLASVAYLDGQKPYAVFARGYYNRSTLVTYSWDGNKLKEYWAIDSGLQIMNNPFNDTAPRIPEPENIYAELRGQGFHSMSVADVDGDGCQEIIYGSATIDNNGELLYVSKAADKNGVMQRMGHGDAMHVTDIDPNRPGLEIFTCHEWKVLGYALRDAKNGEVIFGKGLRADNGRAMVGDIDPDSPGLEAWTYGIIFTSEGKELNPVTGKDKDEKDVRAIKMPGTNANIKWSADLSTQIINGSRDETPKIDSFKKGNLLTAEGTRTNNYTKGNPGLVADILGDFREELLVRTTDSSSIRIYTNTETTNHKLYTLMHDQQYRVEVARQNTAYNQPSYTSFYYATDMDWSKVPLASSSNQTNTNKEQVYLQLNNPNALVGDNKVQIDKDDKSITPVIMNDRTLVPIRFIAEAFKCDVNWDQSTESISIILADGTKVVMKINDTQYSVNGQSKTLELAPQIRNNRTLLPLRTIAQDILGKKVVWNSENSLIVISNDELALDNDAINLIINSIK